MINDPEYFRSSFRICLVDQVSNSESVGVETFRRRMRGSRRRYNLTGSP